jgi:predicted metalloprotease
MNRLISLLLAAILLATALPRAASADQAEDASAALAQARQIFKFASDGDYNAMYDLMHPDAQKVISRETAVATFKAIYGSGAVGRGVPIDISFGPWTWGVTGQEYEYAAAVSFEQPYEQDGKETVRSDTMYLVQDDQGEWRWFLGNSPDFVERIQTIYGGETADAVPLTDGDIIENTVKDLDNFWRGAFSYTDLDYQTPGVVLVAEGDSEQTACGPATSGFWAFYCPPDVTVYLDEAFLTELGKKYTFAEAFVIAHEWAHHIQTSIGLYRVGQYEEPQTWNDVYSIELELMADCMAASWAKDLNDRGLLNQDDIDQTIEFTLKYLGDPPGISEYDQQAHGSAEQRAAAIKGGWEDGFLACNIQV